MQVMVDGKPFDDLNPRVERGMAVWSGPATVQGEVLSLDDAVAASAKEGRRLLTMTVSMMGFSDVLLWGLLWFRTGSFSWALWAVPFMLLMGGGFLWFLQRSLQTARKTLAERLTHVAPRMPPPGTSIAASTEGLSVGGRQTPWSDLAVGAVDITRISTKEGETWRLNTVTLAQPDSRQLVLDAQGISDGQKLVALVWRRLRIKP